MHTTKTIPEITDISVNAHAITKVGDAKHSSTETILGASSLYFDGTTHLNVDGNELLFDFDNDDITIELWFYKTQNPSVTDHQATIPLVTKSVNNTSTNGWGLDIDPNSNSVRFYSYNSASSQSLVSWSIHSTDNVVENKWYHVSVVRNSKEWSMYLNGKLQRTKLDNDSGTYLNQPQLDLLIGAVYSYSSLNSPSVNTGTRFIGYLQDLRISKKAVYTGCFAPPSKLYPNLLNTPLNPECAEVLLHVQSDTTNVSDAVVDSSHNEYEFTKRGNATHSTDQKIHGASSLYFDGDGDALSINKADTLNGDFTFETWVNLKNIPAESEFTLPSEVASSAIDGELLEITEDTTLEYTNDRVSALTSNTITLTSKSGSDFKANQRLLIITTYGSSVETIGNYEFVEIASINGNVLTLKSNIQKTYDVANYTFVVAPKRYNKIIVGENIKVSSVAWSASSNSIQGLVLLSANEIQVKGHIHANERGFRGGTIGNTSNKNGGIEKVMLQENGIYNQPMVNTAPVVVEFIKNPLVTQEYLVRSGRSWYEWNKWRICCW